MLRNQISERSATYADPKLGVNLRAGLEDLQEGEAALMENFIYDGGIRPRLGSTRLTTIPLSNLAVLGGHKYYYGGVSPTGKRLYAADANIYVISDLGVDTSLTSGMTAGQPTFFFTWPFTDSVYISNGVDTIRKYDGTTFSTVSGTNIPIARAQMCGILDRMLAITTDGIEITDPRVDNVWSQDSSWATFRPQFPGLFTAIHATSLKGSDTIYPGALAFQERAFYLITGTDFGADVTAVSASAGVDSAIQLLDGTVGTGSPRSVCSVPGVGTFWFTADLNVAWIPEGTFTVRYIGDKLQSSDSISSITRTNTTHLNKVWMTYYNNFLMLGIPMAGASYPTWQWWLDIRALRNDPTIPVWYGPMTGQSLSCVWAETQQGNNALYGGEANPANDAHIYQLRVPNTIVDAAGLDDVTIECTYVSNYKDLGTPSREKYIQAVHLDLGASDGTTLVSLNDLDAAIAVDLPIEEV